jgi:hypothetical protein
MVTNSEKANFKNISWWNVNSTLQLPWDIQKTIRKANNISNAIIEAANKIQVKIIQLNWPYISRTSKTKFKAEDLLWDPALLQTELSEWYYFTDWTNSKTFTFKVKSPWIIDKIDLDIMNEEGNIVDKINYQLLWTA